jgi:glycosyltransferase involved in cell wall biosynthesis
MSAGVPVLGSSIPGIHEALVDGVSGMIRDFGNVRDVQMGLRHLLSDAALRECFRLAAREKAERDFDINIQAQKIFLQIKLAIEE